MLRPLILLLPLAACSTYLEDKAGLDYAPVYQEAVPTASRTTGGIFHQEAHGLFVSDRRANAVGDVLTVQFVERLQASKSQTASSGRASNFEMTLPSLLPGGLTGAAWTFHRAGFFRARGGDAVQFPDRAAECGRGACAAKWPSGSDGAKAAGAE